MRIPGRLEDLPAEDLAILDAVLEEFGPGAIDDFGEGFPQLGERGGVQAVVSPEGVVVRVLREDEGRDDVRRIVMTDIRERYCRPAMPGQAARGMTPTQMFVESMRVLRAKKGLYRVERLDAGGSP